MSYASHGNDPLTERLPQAAPDARPRWLPAGGRQGSRSRHSQQRSTRRALRAALIATLAVLALVLALGAVYTSALRARLESDAERLALQQGVLGEMEAEVLRLRAERDALAGGRLPGLIPLEYDTALQIDRHYVRNVIFTQTGTAGAHRYEYRMVIENVQGGALRPAAQLLFFDDRGIQIGESEVTRDAIGAPTGIEAWLQPGETRSYTAAVTLAQDATPRYFLLVVE